MRIISRGVPAILLVALSLLGQRYAMASEWVPVGGNVQFGEIPVCALVLVNGQTQFSCDGTGRYDMEVPIDDNGMITVQVYADGFAPFNQIVTPAQAAALPIQMLLDQNSPNLDVVATYEPSATEGRVVVSGTITIGAIPVCALVLANGQNMFSCNENLGQFSLDVPIDPDGNITLFVYAAGFKPFKRITPAPRSNQLKTGSASISGSIENGVLLLVDDRGNIYGQAIVFGDLLEKDPSSLQSKDSYYFSFPNLPENENFRLYLIDDGMIWSIFGDTDGDGTPNSNAFSLSESSNIALGLVNGLEADDGILLTQFDLFDQDGIVEKPSNLSIPAMIEFPSTAALTEQQLLQLGMGALFNGWTGGANAFFNRIVNSTAPGASNTADAARFFLAFSTLASIGLETPTDGDSGTINRIGDVFDLLGIPNDETRGSFGWVEVPEGVEVDTQTSERIGDFIDSETRSNLARAVTLLEQVSQTFNITWIRPDHGKPIENDFSDALFFLGLIKLEQAYLTLGDAYNLEFNLGTLIEKENDDDSANDETVESFLGTNPQFLSLADRSQLALASDLLVSGAISNLEGAINSIEAEMDPQADDLIRLTTLESGQQDISRTRSYLASIRESIQSGPTRIEANDDGDQSKDVILDLWRFFNVGVDFRNDGLLPAIIDNELDKSRPCLPDPTFNGVVVSPDLNDAIYDENVCN